MAVKKRSGKEPETLVEAIRYFADPDVSLNFMASLRWPDGQVKCPICGSQTVTFLPTRRLWQCKAQHPKRQFSVKVGTIFEDSPIGLDKWFAVIWMLANDRNGISSYEVARSVGVTQKTAWFMLDRIRLAMQTGTFAKLSGTVEVDETYIGGKARNMHAAKRKGLGNMRGRLGSGKTVVMGLLERETRAFRYKVVSNLRRSELQGTIKQTVEPGSEVITDAYQSYAMMDSAYAHKVIDHAEKYVEGEVHTNGLENFWSRHLLSIEPFHLFRYLDEQAFRYNNREMNDAQRFGKVAGSVIGKRLTYAELTGKGATA